MALSVGLGSRIRRETITRSVRDDVARDGLAVKSDLVLEIQGLSHFGALEHAAQDLG